MRQFVGRRAAYGRRVPANALSLTASITFTQCGLLAVTCIAISRRGERRRTGGPGKEQPITTAGFRVACNQPNFLLKEMYSMRVTKTGASVLVSLLLGAPAATAASDAIQNKPVFLGTFSRVSFSRESGDCDGFNAQLWLMKGRGPESKVYGFLGAFEGPCEPAVMQVVEGSFDERSGALKFAAVGVVRPKNLKVRFDGLVSASALKGVLVYANDDTGQFGNDAGSPLDLPRVQTRSRLRR